MTTRQEKSAFIFAFPRYMLYTYTFGAYNLHMQKAYAN